MTFEIAFNYNNILFKADVTISGRDFLVNLTSPAQYEASQTMAFTIHDDESMKYDTTMFDDKEFMPIIEKAIIDHIHLNKIVVQ